MTATLARIILFSFLFLLVMPHLTFADTKTFIKEYTYQASDFDSKISSRTIALEQVKRLLLEEVGTYLISETDVKDFQLTKDKITTLTAGIVQAEILNEKWDGKTYYLKAKMSIAPQEVTKFLEGLRENSQKNRELEETKRKVDEALKKIKQLQDERVAGQRLESKQNEYSKAVAELKAKEWIDKGIALMTAENYESALSAFNNAVEIDPTSSWAYINKGWALNALGDYYQALKEFSRAFDIDPKNPWIYVNRGVSYNFLGDYRQGLLDEEKAINLDATISWAYINRGWAYIGLGNFNQALADLNNAAQLDPKNSHVYHLRAWAHNGLGNKRQTLEDFDKSLNLAPNNSWTYWNIATYYALSGEKEKSISALGQAIRINDTLRQKAKTDKNFQSLWNDIDFKKIVD
ncbi:MAG: tetratricopeptide repeat protein [Planctomycetota bacterium]